MKESELVKLCLDWLATHGAFCWRQNQGALAVGKRFVRFSRVKGVSDIIGTLKGGRFLACECKVGRNKPTADQQAFLHSVWQSGGLAVLAYSLDDLIKAVEQS